MKVSLRLLSECQNYVSEDQIKTVQQRLDDRRKIEAQRKRMDKEYNAVELRISELEHGVTTSSAGFLVWPI